MAREDHGEQARPSRSMTLWRWIPVVAVMIAIFVLSSISGLRVSHDASVDAPLRSLAHVAAYAALAAALVFALSGKARPSAATAALAFVVALAYGVTDELHQTLVPDRTGQLDDLLLDAVGALAGVAAMVLLLQRIR